MTHEENRIAADDLRSHRELGNDLMKMEREKQKLEIFDELVDSLESCARFVGQTDPYTASIFLALVADARAIK